MTYNNGKQWSNGQLGILLQLPDQQQLQHWEPISILLAPPGVRTLPIISLPYTECAFIAFRWKKII